MANDGEDEYAYNNDDENGEDMEYGWMASEEGLSSFFSIFFSLLALVLILSNLLHKNQRLATVLPEAGMIILVGLVSGICIYFFSDETFHDDDGDDGDFEQHAEDEGLARGLLSFSPNVFFVALLPPIIFNSGYHLNKGFFVRHATPIVLFSCIGTAVSTVAVALVLYVYTQWSSRSGNSSSFQPTFSELMTFGGLISATDPVSTLAVFQEKRVDPQLFYLVFGESVLNDAVGLVLFHTLAKFVGHEKEDNSYSELSMVFLRFLMDFTIGFLGSLLLGVLCGIAAGLVFKWVDMRSTRLLELSTFVLVMYVPFFLAEILPFSGIVTALFTGMSARQYAEPNLSSQTAEDSDLLFRVTAHMAETAIFLELGLSIFGLSAAGNIHPTFTIVALLGCAVGRVVNVYPITFLYNLSLRGRQRRKLVDENQDGVVPSPQQHHDIDNNNNKSHVNSSTLEICSVHTHTRADREDQKIEWKTAHIMNYSGLRGAVAYACAKDFPNAHNNRTDFVITTVVIVLVTVFLLGGSTNYMLRALDIQMGVDEEKYIAEQELMREDSWLEKMEQRFILPYVLRKYQKPKPPPVKLPRPFKLDTPLAPNEVGAPPPPIHTIGSGESCVTQLTTDQVGALPGGPCRSMESVSEMLSFGLMRPKSPPKLKKRSSSIYDFGFNS